MYRFEETGRVRRAVRLVVTSRPVAALSARFLPRIDRLALRLTGGRNTFSAWSTGLPVIELRTVGARSGAPRTVNVLGVPDHTAVVVIAANFGQTSSPAWYFNIRAHPHVEIVIDGAPQPFTATELHGSERDKQFDRAVLMNPGWLRFRRRAGRVIPVIRLSPTAR